MKSLSQTGGVRVRFVPTLPVPLIDTSVTATGAAPFSPVITLLVDVPGMKPSRVPVALTEMFVPMSALVTR